ncbi:MAG: D-alanine--D-alanine ligase [bacterium]|nr:D-alanine--D-alanine ligase [bacterium]
MVKKVKVAVISGGPSAEHEVSLNTGKMVAAKLDKSKYDVEEIIVDKNGQWPIEPKNLAADVVFIAMHGEYGEDGTVQKTLENAGLAYTGSGVKASKLGMDKAGSSAVLANSGLLIPKFITITDGQPVSWPHGFPAVIKPADRGSSVGISIIHSPEELPAALKESFKYSNVAMIQEYIAGRELTCGVIDDGLGNITPLLPTEIIPITGKFFDYDAKYKPGASKEITPPNLPEAIIRSLRQMAVTAHQAIGCSGMSRTDFILHTSDNKQKIYVLEINTIPGLTETSLLPQEAQAVGISFSELLDRVITAALNKR